MFSNMIKYTAGKGRKACFATTRKSLSLGRLTVKIAVQLFDSYVLPVLNYGSEIWCKNKPMAVIETVQLKFLKFILGVKNSTCSDAIYGELGRFPLYLSQIVKLIKYWSRIIKLDKDKLVYKAYCTLIELDDYGFMNWVSSIRELLSLYNL